ncbi:MAG: NADPH-dependent 7-cyano-7-deazaguanine reductase QueF [Endomicrobiales bacterium]|nr:NADPH-dependent 7-cyano-7-deazaguanine reductase QueF [Endomicrobiales bacterium]
MLKNKLKKLKPTFNQVDPSLLEVMPYEYPGKRIELNIETSEFTCLCPWSGLPDFANLVIRYVPNKKVIELKSLKYYLHSYRQVGIVHESAVNRILNDLVKVCKPKGMTVELAFNIRGGLKTTVKAGYKKNV